MARPFSPCRKTASLPETPCASRPADSTARNRTISTSARLLSLISGMAVITRRIEIAAGRDNPVLVLGLRRLQRRFALFHEIARHLHPVALVDHPGAHQQQVA